MREHKMLFYRDFSTIEAGKLLGGKLFHYYWVFRYRVDLYPVRAVNNDADYRLTNRTWYLPLLSLPSTTNIPSTLFEREPRLCLTVSLSLSRMAPKSEDSLRARQTVREVVPSSRSPLTITSILTAHPTADQPSGLMISVLP